MNDQVYNVDEIGLFYHMLLNKTLALKTDNFPKGFFKKGKDLATIMACYNVSGKHKFQLC